MFQTGNFFVLQAGHTLETQDWQKNKNPFFYLISMIGRGAFVAFWHFYRMTQPSEQKNIMSRLLQESYISKWQKEYNRKVESQWVPMQIKFYQLKWDKIQLKAFTFIQKEVNLAASRGRGLIILIHLFNKSEIYYCFYLISSH